MVTTAILFSKCSNIMSLDARTSAFYDQSSIHPLKPTEPR